MPQVNWNEGLFAKHSQGLDPSVVTREAEAIESEAFVRGGNTPQGAYRWLSLNTTEAISQLNPLGPHGRERVMALAFVRENLYHQIIHSEMDLAELERLRADYTALVEHEVGSDPDAQLKWLSANIPRIARENIEDYEDWHLRNRAIGLIHKQLNFSKVRQQPSTRDQSTAQETQMTTDRPKRRCILSFSENERGLPVVDWNTGNLVLRDYLFLSSFSLDYYRSLIGESGLTGALEEAAPGYTSTLEDAHKALDTLMKLHWQWMARAKSPSSNQSTG